MGSAISEHIRRVAVGETLSRHGIAHDSELGKQLMAESEIAGERDPIVRTTSGVSLDQRLEELSHVAKFAGDCPKAKPTVCSSDMWAMSQNFESIARGETVVKGDR